MSGFPVITDGGTLTLASGYALPNPAVALVEWGLGELWTPQVQGKNFAAAGTTWALPRDLAEQKVSIPVAVVGEVDSAGDPTADPTAGLFLNLQELIAELMGPNVRPDASTSVAGFVSADWVPYDGAAAITARFQVESVQVGDRHRNWCTAVIRATLPDGPMIVPVAP